MPLFHIHGLIAAVLVERLPPAARSVCTQVSLRCDFFAWLDDALPTWYTAVPTMHQAILAARRAVARDPDAPPAALRALVLCLAAAAGDGGSSRATLRLRR
jgi:acyl-CoA synthetase (AMP-forming)/AMP-acid ligase II